MLTLLSTLLANEPPYCVTLHCCECGNNFLADCNNFETITPDCVILKNNINITCEKCGASQSKDKKVIHLEPQTAAPKYDSVHASKLPFWMTRDITPEELCRAIVVE